MSAAQSQERVPAPARARSAEAKAERRSEILAAAKATFAIKGYHDTKVSDVAKAAGISYGSIYWYFDSKDALFHALMDHEQELLRDHIAHSTEGSPGALDGDSFFRAAVRATFEFFEADRDVVRLLFRDSLVLGDRFEGHLANIYEGFIADIEATVGLAQSAGYVVDAPPRIVAFSVAALISQLAVRRLTVDDDLTTAEVADIVVDLLLRGLLPRPDDPPARRTS
ncbi:MAG: TetR/AcrR family transcriptional regulator [Actinomycetota bacterium]|jgi:AcrR family transcriptional regulator|nr:TetR/AcrR family transcriptional regulator [Actinomycetota bacterium]